MEMHNGIQRRNGFNLQFQSSVIIYFGKYMLFSRETTTAGFIKECQVTEKFPITFFNLKTFHKNILLT